MPSDPIDNSPDMEAYPASAPAPSAGLSRYWAALRQKWWVFLLTIPLGVGAGYAYLQWRPHDFVSKAQMWVTGTLRISDVGQYTEDNQNFFGTQITIMLSGKMQDRALSRLKTAQPDLNPPKDANGQIDVKVRVSQAPKSTVFILQASSSDGVFAQQFLDALMEEFLAYRREVRSASSGSALASVSDQIFKQERELKIEQDRLADFQRSNNVALLQGEASGGGSLLAQLKGQLATHKLELQLLDATAIEQTNNVASQTNAPPITIDTALLPVPGTTAAHKQTDFISARQQLDLLISEREQLAKDLKPKHPKMIRIEEEISRAERAIDLYRQQNQEQLANAKQALQLRIDSVQQTIKDLESRVGDATRRLSELDRIRNGIQLQQGYHSRLLDLLQNVDINTTMNQENLAILERAGPAISAGKPSWQILAGSAAGGLAAGILVLFLVGRFDDRCDSLEELRSQFMEEILGQIPNLKAKHKKRHLPLLQIKDDRHVFAESCRCLRSSLLYGNTNGSQPKLILVTSAVPGEGKSTVASNLARALAFAGANVLLIDGDLRRGHLHDILGLPAEPGLSELLRDLETRWTKKLGKKWKTGDREQGAGDRGQRTDGKSQNSELGDQSAVGSGQAADNPQSAITNSDPFVLDPHSALAFDAAIKSTEIPNLAFLPRGGLDCSPSELFLGSAFAGLLERARCLFDYVIMDSVPVFAADDTTSVAPKLDAVLFVVCGARTSSRVARQALELLYQRQTKILGLVFNRANSKARSYYYYKDKKYYRTTG